MLHNIAKRIHKTSEEEAPVISVRDMSADGLGKVRYCGSWAMFSCRQQCLRYVSEHVYSTKPEVHERVLTEHKMLQHLDETRVTSDFINDKSVHKDTLRVTEERQYRSKGLRHITDI